MILFLLIHDIARIKFLKSNLFLMQIHCATTAEQVSEWNAQREEADRYSQEM